VRRFVAIFLLATAALPLAAQSRDDWVQIRKGEYLARVGNCVSCHTVMGGQPFAGGVAFPTSFGTVYSTNITPDRNTGIGAWTLADFSAALRNGVRPDGQHLYPAFPYTELTKLTDDDVAALYAYFMKLEPVASPSKANDMKFPFGQRGLLGVWKAMFFTEGRYKNDSVQSAQWNRGAYLVQGLAHCGSCHSPRNLLGATRTSQAFTGGILEQPLDDGERDVTRGAPNITQSLHGLAAWSEDDIAGYLKEGVSSRARLMGTMNEVVLNSTRYMKDEDLRAMAVYLKSLPASDGDAGKPASETMQLGARQYDIHCGTCHMPTGLGSADTAPPLRGSAFAQAPDPSSLIDLVMNGPRVPPVTPSEAYGKRPWTSMEPFFEKLSDEEAAALFTYVRNSWGNGAGEVSPGQVGALR